MLIIVQPSKVTDYWPTFEGHIEQSLPPTAQAPGVDANQILYSLMVGSAQCWLYTNAEQELKGFLITSTYADLSDVRTLMLYNVVVFDKTVQVDWAQEFETLRRFAIERRCNRIAAFIANEKIVEMLHKWGADTSFTYAVIDV